MQASGQRSMQMTYVIEGRITINTNTDKSIFMFSILDWNICCTRLHQNNTTMLWKNTANQSHCFIHK